MVKPKLRIRRKRKDRERSHTSGEPPVTTTATTHKLKGVWQGREMNVNTLIGNGGKENNDDNEDEDNGDEEGTGKLPLLNCVCIDGTAPLWSEGKQSKSDPPCRQFEIDNFEEQIILKRQRLKKNS